MIFNQVDCLAAMGALDLWVTAKCMTAMGAVSHNKSFAQSAQKSTKIILLCLAYWALDD